MPSDNADRGGKRPELRHFVASAYMNPEMTRPFVKMNGAGNDFVVVNALDRPFTPTPGPCARSATARPARASTS